MRIASVKHVHAALVYRAASWLWRQGCVLVATEFSTQLGETPDAIGWKKNGYSILVECKTSRADFLNDRKKRSRIDPETSVGLARYYFTVKGLIEDHREIQEPWGLLEWDVLGKQRVYKVKESYVETYSHRSEIEMLLSMIRRFDEQHLRGVSVKAYIQRSQTVGISTIGFKPEGAGIPLDRTHTDGHPTISVDNVRGGS